MSDITYPPCFRLYCKQNNIYLYIVKKIDRSFELCVCFVLIVTVGSDSSNNSVLTFRMSLTFLSMLVLDCHYWVFSKYDGFSGGTIALVEILFLDFLH